MKNVNLATVDLNLLKTFMAVWEARSLTTAAEMLHLSQPAVSHALRRLREVFDDPLFIRTGSGMVPTDAAVQLHAPIDDAMALIRGALQRHGSFDAMSAQRTFRMSMSDTSELHVIPKLAAHLMRCAPGVQIETRSLPIPELDAAMRSGDIEIALGYMPGLGEDCVGEDLLTDRFVCMLRDGHPLAGQELTTDILKQLSFVGAETNKTGHPLAERAMRAAGVVRHKQVRIDHFTVAPHVVAATDLALIVPQAIARTMQASGRFAIKELPFAMPPVNVKVYCHKRFLADPGIVWMRRQLIDLLKEGLDDGAAGGAPGRMHLSAAVGLH